MSTASGRPGAPGRPDAVTPRRGRPAPPPPPHRARPSAAPPPLQPPPLEPPPLERPVSRAPLQRSWLATWWAPALQLVALAALVVSGAAVIDSRHGTAAADLAADRGAGPRVSVRRAALRHAAPVGISIARLGLRSTLVDLRLNPNGTVQVPTDFGKAGWYVGSAHPGDAGPTVLIGHVDSTKGPGVFYRVPQLRAGDRISVARADRTTALFVVTRVLRVPKKDFPTALVYRGDGQPSLRLVTCGGAFDQATGHYLDNVIVLAVPAPVSTPAASRPAP